MTMSAQDREFVLTGDRDDLLAAFNTASRFTASHGSTAHLNNLHVVNKEGASYVEASDQRMSIRSHLWGTFDSEVDVLISPTISRAIGAMPAGEVTVTSDGAEITVTGKGKSKYTVPIADAEFPDAFPGLGDISWDDIAAVDAADALKTMVEASKFVAKKDTNPSLTGVNLRVIDGDLGIEASDGHCLFHDRVPLPSKGFPFEEDEVLLPARMVRELRTIFASGEIQFAATVNLLFARSPSGETLFAARRIGGKFPNIDNVIPQYASDPIVLSREEAEQAVKRMRGVVSGRAVTLTPKDATLRLHARGVSGSAEEEISLTKNPVVQAFALNIDHLGDALSLFENDDELSIDVLSALRPVRFRGAGVRTFVITTVRPQ